MTDFISSDYFENVKTRDTDKFALNELKQGLYYIERLQKIGITQTDNVKNQLDIFISFYENRINQLEKVIFDVEKNVQQFALCVLFNENRKVYICRRKNPKKDFCDYYQVTGGKLEGNESFEDCARREAKEEAGVEIESMSYVALDKYIDKTTDKLFECAIYIGYIGRQIPSNTEPENHDNWELVDLKNFKTYKLTISLERYHEDIKNSISHHRFCKKRKLEKFVKLEDVLVNNLNNEIVLELGETSDIKTET